MTLLLKLLIFIAFVVASEAGEVSLKCENATGLLVDHPMDQCDSGNTCLVQNIIIGENTNVTYHEEILRVKTWSLPGSNQSEHHNVTWPEVTKCLVFKNSTVFVLPKNLLTKFYEIKKIYAVNSSMEQVDSLNKTGYLPIDSLDLSYNKIQVLEKPVVNVCNMDLSHNGIHAILSPALKNLKDCGGLSKLDLSYNQLTNFSLEWFDSIQATKVHLDFSNNLISEISGVSKKEYGGDFELTRHLDLSKNKLNKFPAVFLEQVLKLTHLNLSRNQIDSVKNLRDIKKFASGNHIDYNLEALDLSYNNIKEFSLKDLGKVSADVLNISYNKIESISRVSPVDLILMRKNDGKFIGFKSAIDMSHNQLQALPIRLFDHIQSSKFDLSHNQITGFENYEKKAHSMIGWLDISHNKIKELSLKAISKISAGTLDLSHNKIENFKEFEDVKKITTLILKNNHITQIPFQAFPKSSIKNLILMNNKVVLRFGIFPETVEYLDLRHNHLGRKVHENYFLVYQKLKVLRLEGNEIHQNFLTQDLKDSSIKKLGIARNRFTCEVLAKILILLEECKVDYQFNQGIIPRTFDDLTYTPEEYKIVDPDYLIYNRSNINGIGCKE